VQAACSRAWRHCRLLLPNTLAAKDARVGSSDPHALFIMIFSDFGWET
jgi:hypothetical protein